MNLWTCLWEAVSVTSTDGPSPSLTADSTTPWIWVLNWTKRRQAELKRACVSGSPFLNTDVMWAVLWGCCLGAFAARTGYSLESWVKRNHFALSHFYQSFFIIAPGKGNSGMHLPTTFTDEETTSLRVVKNVFWTMIVHNSRGRR